jgi:hypothetical protein
MKKGNDLEQYEEDTPEAEEEELDNFIKDNWSDLAKHFISQQEAEFRAFCKEDFELTQ